MSKTIDDISVVVNARVNSTRIYHKLIRPFSNTTLLDLCLARIENMKLPKYLAACEEEIMNVGERYDVLLLERDPFSVQKGFRDQRITFAHYSKIPTRYICSINPCCPFIQQSTYEEGIEYFLDNDEHFTLTTIKELHNIYLNSDFQPLNITSLAVSTLNNKPIYEFSHLFHIFDKYFFLKNGYFWNYSPGNPAYFIVDKMQSIDIDDMEDFIIAEILYEKDIRSDCK